MNPKTKKQTKTEIYEGKPLERALRQSVLDPISRIFAAVMNLKKEEIPVLLGEFEIRLKSEEMDLEGKALLGVMTRKLRTANALI